MITKINHVGIVVPDFEEGKKLYGEIYGLKHLRDEVVEAYGCEIAFYEIGDALLEIVHPIAPGPSWNFLHEKGPGIHHICFEDDNIEERFKIVKDAGMTDYEELDHGAGGAKIFFLTHPATFDSETEFTGK